MSQKLFEIVGFEGARLSAASARVTSHTLTHGRSMGAGIAQMLAAVRRPHSLVILFCSNLALLTMRRWFLVAFNNWF